MEGGVLCYNGGRKEGQRVVDGWGHLREGDRGAKEHVGDGGEGVGIRPRLPEYVELVLREWEGGRGPFFAATTLTMALATSWVSASDLFSEPGACVSNANRWGGGGIGPTIGTMKHS